MQVLEGKLTDGRLFLKAKSVNPFSRPMMLLVVLGTALTIVLSIGLLTNYLGPKWDTKFYLNMATKGLVHNKQLAAPFAYRPAAPLLVGGIARAFKLEPEAVFRACGSAMCIAFVLASFCFARSTGASFQAAWLSSILAALYFFIVKWTVFSGAMMDIYAYPIVLFAFWALLRNRFYLCLAVCSVGLFFKEFLLLPLLTQTSALVWRNRQRPLRLIARPLCLTVAVLCICFLAPRMLIHVASTFQDIDPLNNPSSLRLLVIYPASLKRDFNIVFVYLACWLPVLLLLTAQRLQTVWNRLRPYRLILGLYLAFHLILVMYGGTNLEVFVTYALPVELWVLTILFDEGRVPVWERALTTAAVIVFNRLWMHVPLPQDDVNAYLNFYGGYHTYVTWRSLGRMAELGGWIALMCPLRYWFSVRRPISRAMESQ